MAESATWLKFDDKLMLINKSSVLMAKIEQKYLNELDQARENYA